MKWINSTCVIGSDGSASVLRESMVESYGIACQEEILDYGYKELTIPPGAAGAHLMEKGALHIWPRGKFMLIALPNRDGSFTCTLFLPFQGEFSFANFSDDTSGRAQIHSFFQEYFPDACRLIPDLEEAMIRHPLGKMVTVNADQWNHAGQALLIGDAAHAIVPFFGQGLNCSFEDCTIFNSFLGQEKNMEPTFKRFFHARKADADAIAQLALNNFVEMRDKVAQPRFLLEKEIEKLLMKKYPNYVSRYSMVTFSREPYLRALQLGRAQDKILSQLSNKIQTLDELDMALVQKLMEQYQKDLHPSQGRQYELRN